MFKKKNSINLSSDEKRILIISLNELRNTLISQDHYTDCVDELLIKVASCKPTHS